jgi:hypothetical protein
VPHVWLFALFVLAMPVVGLIAASGLFVAGILVLNRFSWSQSLAVAVGFVALETVILAAIFDVLTEREMVGRIAWSWLGY